MSVSGVQHNDYILLYCEMITTVNLVNIQFLSLFFFEVT